jgi:hypothetical protein
MINVSTGGFAVGVPPSARIQLSDHWKLTTSLGTYKVVVTSIQAEPEQLRLGLKMLGTLVPEGTPAATTLNDRITRRSHATTLDLIFTLVLVGMMAFAATTLSNPRFRVHAQRMWTKMQMSILSR